MSAKTKATLLGIAGGVGGVVAALRKDRAADTGDGRRHAVTVNREVTETPAPLAALGDEVEVRLRPAPRDRGTEIFARGGDTEAVRKALRESRSLLEIGEVVQPNLNRTTEETALNRPLAAATPRGREEGLL